jgi:hypothetical protein
MTGGPISDRRLIEVKDGRVYFWARSHDKSGRQVPVSLSTIEFIRHWTLHILPKGFTKARCYGGWSNTRRAAYQQQCDRLQPFPLSPAADCPIHPDSSRTCVRRDDRDDPVSAVQTEMELESHTRRPSWRELFYGPDHPRWIEWRGSG